MRDTLCKIFRGKAIWTARLQWALFLAALAWFPGAPRGALANPLPAGSSAVSSKKLPPKIDAIQNFHWVDHRSCRGGQVQKSQFKLLKEAGVTTVLNLREDFKEWEQAEAEKAGLKYLNIPMSSTRYPSDEGVRKIVEYIGTPGEHGRRLRPLCRRQAPDGRRRRGLPHPLLRLGLRQGLP